MVKWCLGLAAAGPVTAPLFAQTAPFPILLQGHALGQETRETSSMAALGNWHSAGGSAPRIRQGTLAGPLWHQRYIFQWFPFQTCPSLCWWRGRGRVHKSDQLWALPDSESLECLLQTLRVWNVGCGLWAHVPDSLPTLLANAGQGRAAPTLEFLQWAGNPGAKGKAWYSLGRFWDCRWCFPLGKGGVQLPLSNLEGVLASCQGTWNLMIFRVLSITNHSVIPWFHFPIQWNVSSTLTNIFILLW